MNLGALDSRCIRWGLSASSAGHRLSWRVGETVRKGGNALHETALRAARALGIPYVPAAWLDASGRDPRPLGPFLYPSPTDLDRDAEAALADLRAGRWSPDAGVPFLLGESGWSAASETERSMQARFLWHSLHPAALLLAAHRRHGHAEDAARALALALRWTETCLYREREETLWDDHITAMRALLLCDAWTVAARSGAASTGDLRSLGAALARHAERLALPAFYRPGHNHGLTQAFALLAVATALHAHPSAPRWSRLGRDRLEGQMADNVSAEGVHLEHSPYYHFFVLRQFLGAWRLARAAGTPLGAAYEERLHRMLDAGASMIEPGGGLAPLGDTWQGAPILLTDEEFDAFAPERTAALRLARSAGWPAAGSALYEGGGLAVIRSRAAAGETYRAARYLAVRLSVFPTSHVHSDAASFTFHAYGRPLLVDSGGPYGYGDPLRHGYFTTTGAHNTVVVDGGNQRPGPATIRRWEPNGAIQILDAEHENYAGVRHRRSLFFVRDRFVFLVDRLESASSHRYEQRFHFAAHLEVRREGRDAVAVDPDGGASLRLVPLGGATGELTLHRGDGGADGRSAWICTGDRERVAAWGAVCEAEGSGAWFATLLAPAPGGSPPAVSVDRLDAGESDGIRIRVETEGLRAVLSIGGGAAPRVEEEGT